MGSNQLVLLDILLQEYAVQLGQPLASAEDSDAAGRLFGRFVVDLSLRDRDLEPDDLADGVVEGSRDAGIDAIYTFVDNRLVAEGFDYDPSIREPQIDLVVIQAKRQKSFDETPLDRLDRALPAILSINAPPSPEWNAELAERVARFRRVYELAMTAFPRISVEIIYATRGTQLSAGVEQKARSLEARVRQIVGNKEHCKVTFLGPDELIERARRHRVRREKLRFAKCLSTEVRAPAYAGLVRLADFAAFLRDEAGGLRLNLFDANVRDYYGDVEVNRGIRQSLAGADDPDFWWLNNGVTILTTRSQYAGESIAMENPLIVNGLQTSHEIHRHFTRESPEGNVNADERHVLVRVIEEQDSAVRDRIIQATNSQTPIPREHLWTTLPIHRALEEFFRSRGYYYERRRNQYRNEGKPLSKIITVRQVTQAVVAVFLREPNEARARPTQLIKTPERHDQVFNSSLPLALFLNCALMVRLAEDKMYQRPSWTFVVGSEEEALSRVGIGFPTSRQDKGNLRFYVALAASRLAAGPDWPDPSRLASFDLESEIKPVLATAVDLAWHSYARSGGDDRAAKSTLMRDDLVWQLNASESERQAANAPVWPRLKMTE